MQTFAARGYTRLPQADTAFIDCANNRSLVALAYQKPGAVIDSFHVVIPHILVETMTPAEPVITTMVTGGLAYVDGVQGTIRSADSEGSFMSSDPSFDVVDTRFSSGDPSHFGLTASSVLAVQPASSYGWTEFGQYVNCWGVKAWECVFNVLMFGGPGTMPIKVTALLADPELGALVTGGCLVIGGTFCLWRQ